MTGSNEMAVMEAIAKTPQDLTYRQKVAYLVQELSAIDQVKCPVKHFFAPHVYLREIFMPAGTVVIGRIHRTEHFNIIEQGVCSIVHDDGQREILRAPLTFVSKAGVQKILYIHEDTRWKTVHVTDETDPDRLDELLIEPPPVVLLNKPQEVLQWPG